MDLELVVAAAPRHVGLGFADQVVERVARPSAAAVGGDPVGDPAPELVERQPRRLPDDVPQRDVERAERIGRDALALDAAIRAVHALPQPLDQRRVLAHQQRRKTRVEVGLDGLGTTAAEGQGVAQAGEALVGANVRDDQAVVREVERDGLAVRNAQHGAVDGGDFHGRHPRPGRSASAMGDGSAMGIGLP